MAYPPAYERTFSFTDFETLNPGEPKPGVEIDTEFDNVSNALTATQNNLALIQRADGALANDSVGEDQLQDDVFDGIADGITADAEAAAAAAAGSASAAASSAAAADTSATAAATSAATASGAAAMAGVSQSIAQDAATEAAFSAGEAAVSADESEIAANETAGSVAACEAHVERAFEWAELLTGPVLPAPPGWPEAVDDGMFSAKWWAIRARQYNTVTNIDLGSGQPDIGDAWDEWIAAGNTPPLGLVYATWGVPPQVYVLTDPNNPSDPASWTSITGPTGPMGPPGAGGLADPTALIGLTTIPGVATSGMRSDAAPALSQAIAPTWTGAHTFNALVNLAGALQANSVDGISGQVLSTQGAGLPPVWRTPGGGAIEMGYNFNTSTATANPGSQKLAYNNTTFAGTTVLHINITAFTNFDASTILSLLQAGNRIYMQQRNDASKAAIYQVTAPATNNTGWWSVPVTLVNSLGTPFPNNADLNVVFIMSASTSTTFANPTGTIGLTAVNGVLSTAMRSDSAPPLSQAIAPTWTAKHIFANDYFSGGSIEMASGLPALIFNETDAAAGARKWLQSTNSSQMNYYLASDDITTTLRAYLQIVRSGAAVASMAFGNATDNPTYTFLGTGIVTTQGLIRGPAGTVAAPTYSFTSDTGLGMYRIGANILGFAVGGAEVVRFSGGILTSSIRVQVPDGTFGSPSYSWTSDPNTGLFSVAADTIGVSTNGAEVARFLSSGGLQITGAIGGTFKAAAGIELGVSGATAYVQAYDRGGAAYLPLNVNSTYANFFGATGAVGEIYIGTKRALTVNNDGWLRLNNNADFGSGVYSPYIIRADGGFHSDAGLISPSQPTRMIKPNGTAGGMTYGSVFAQGTANGYGGYAINDGLAPCFMSDGASVAGIYVGSDGKWIFNRSSSTAIGSGYNVSALSFNATSSRAVKRETGKPSKVADMLSRLRPILYRLLADEDREQLGLIAEEVHDVCPQLSDGKTVSYDRLAILLLAAWQEQNAAA